MEQIPNELLVQIFNQLHPVYDKLAWFSVICKRWNNLIRHTSSLWEHIHLGPKLLTETERTILFTCFNEFEPFIKCLRIASLEVVFGDEFWFFIHRATYELRNLTCLDVPTFPWNLEQFVGLRSAHTIKELNLYGFWDLSDVQWTQSFSQPFSLINDGHLHLVKTRCRNLEVLKLSMNMLRVTESELMAALDALNLKELQISAYNGNFANIPLSGDTVKLLKDVFASRHVSAITKLDLRYVSMGHKELRLLLRLLSALRYLKLFFNDTSRCMAGYQFLESKSLEFFELDGLPAINIVNLKCSMPRLRRFVISGCSNLLSLRFVSSTLQELILNRLTNLRSLHLASSSLKFVEFTNCSSLSSEVIHKVLCNNPRTERCILRGDFLNVRSFQIDNTNHSFTELSICITNQFIMRHIQVHCQTLRSFICNYQSINGGWTFSPLDTCIDIRSDVLAHCYISIPRVNSVNIKCAKLDRLLLNLGPKNLNMVCRELRVDAGKNLSLFCADKCLFTHLHIHADEINALDLCGGDIEEPMTLEGDIVHRIFLRNQVQPKETWNLIAHCKKISKVILKDCSVLATINAFVPEPSIFKEPRKSEGSVPEIHNITPLSSCIIHGNDISQHAQDYEALSLFDHDFHDKIACLENCTIFEPKTIVDKVVAISCPCFQGVVVKTGGNQNEAACNSTERAGESGDCLQLAALTAKSPPKSPNLELNEQAEAKGVFHQRGVDYKEEGFAKLKESGNFLDEGEHDVNSCSAEMEDFTLQSFKIGSLISAGLCHIESGDEFGTAGPSTGLHVQSRNNDNGENTREMEN